MGVTAEQAPLGQPAHPPDHSQSAFPIVVAITDDGFAAAAVHVAEALAVHRGAHPSLLYVMKLMLSATSDGLLGVSTAAMMEELLDPESLRHSEAELRKTLHLDTGLPATWPFTVDVGQVIPCLMQHVQLAHSALVVMGLHHHGAMGHALGNDTGREIMAVGKVPVLAVRPQLVALPRSVVVAMDFSRASLRAAHLARSLMDDAGTLHLVFVEPTIVNPISESAEGRALIEAKGVEAAFQQVAEELRPGPDMTIIPLCATGDTVAELTRVCEQVQPDLFAIGSQRHPFLEKLRLGSIAAAMVHNGRWSVLVTPPAVTTPTHTS